MENKELNSFLGRGWAFPPELNPEAASVSLVENETDIEQSLYILLSTAAGERVLRADYGADVSDMLFEPIHANTIGKMTDRIRRAVLFHEPRIKLEDLRYFKDPDAENNGIIRLLLEYTIITTNTRNNLVYDYYLTEATDAKV
ncbi:MAG: GPW/gp25 family protein [Bacteroidetes bacterium]|nr:GPW/gp25 family protein [Bacteroidota bacterium]